MEKPKIPDNEKQRLAALKTYDILDSLPEKDYDDLTLIAAEICDAPIALITLIDENRQFFKSRIGVDIEDTPREYSFCSHAINLPDQLMQVEDTSMDQRFVDNPYVIGEPKITFYAGVPLVNPEGYAFGTLCVLDSKAKRLNERQERALKSLANQVMHLLELRKKNKELELSRKKVDAYARETEEFVYAASHDLKEPLRMIRSFLKLLKKKHSQQLNEEGSKYLSYASDGVKRMQMMIADMLEYYRLNMNELTAEKVDISKLVDEVSAFYKREHQDAEIKHSGLPAINASGKDLRMVFENLIGNAIKYRKAENHPVITVRAEANTGGDWVFSIADNGVGIPEDHLERIFGLFQRAHSGKQYPGTGIGLAICKKIIEKAGGKIWVESKLDAGSTFFFTWPENV
ncbi:sensor histidine kinase [Cyclobacterium plantarum]|uniref:sensor histidine kinase n=1 Tax=Cyclobacterium plantarum TaxID=2716263 RepID=UPI003F713EB3